MTGGMAPIWKDMRPADLATLLNVLMGVLAIAAAATGDTSLAFHLIFAAVIVDGLDGAVARLGGGGGPLGAIIDTLADVVTFVAAPVAVLIAHFGANTPTVAGGALFAVAGILRLARFQTAEEPYFFGLSSPGGAIVVGSIALLGMPVEWAPLLGLATGTLMLMRWPVPKLRGIIGVAGVLIILANLGLWWWGYGEYGLMAQLGFTGIYLIAGPAYLKARQRVVDA